DVPTTQRKLQGGVRYIVNFAPELREMISEAYHLELQDHALPDLAKIIALQEDKFIRYVNDLRKMINRYHSVMDSLSDAQSIMLEQHITAVEEEMQFGCKRLNWTSLGINGFIKRGSQSVSKFESVVNQIQMNEKEIESKLQVIGMASLLKFSVPDNDLPGVKDFFERIERDQTKTVNLLSRMYADIGPLITKTEHLLLGTSSGNAKCMAGYYKYWERKVLDSLTKMVLRNLQSFNVVLMGSTALFQIDAILPAPKIVTQPQSKEIYLLMKKCLKDCIESTK
ncbi:dynein heavy chain 10, axonemal-like, partial [Notothenia coriiceps]|uniref:Dynein heavy chain 10, axonemal-like n=1 Tax=Notothenia coriiceps TaxID=8208 RepID=A0A6I9N783_9TELE